jgi:phage baseplate assembly protein W
MTRAFSIEDGGLAQTTTVKATRNREYIDLDAAFAAKGSGDVYKKTSVASVKQALKILLMTNRTEKPFSPYFGANLQDYLFELADNTTLSSMVDAIQENIRVFEPRIDFRSVRVFPELDDNNNSLTLTIYFNIVNSSEEVEFTTRLNRLR